ncbi:ABC transporter ATP-binding protein [Chloroflexota bacterium]
MSKSDNKEIHTDSILKIIWFFFKPYKLRVFLLLVLFLTIGGLEAATIAALYPILTVAFDSGAEQANMVLSIFRTLASMLPIEDEFISYCVLFLVLAALSFAIKLASTIFRVKLNAILVKKNQIEIFNKLVMADYQYFIDHKQGELIYIAATAPQQLSTLMIGVTEFISQTILSISILVLLFSLSWQGALSALTLGIAYQLFAKQLGRKVSYRSGKGEMGALQESNVILTEVISGIKQVKTYAIEENWIDRFEKAVQQRWQFNVNRDIWGQIPPLVLFLALYMGVGMVVLIIKLVAPADFLELIPVFGVFAFAVFRLIPFVSGIGSMVMSVLGVLPDCETVYTTQNIKLNLIEDGEKELSSFKSAITFDNVYFSHKSRARTIEAVSVSFEKGKTTALVGRSGVGKTTLVNLLLRLFDVNSGEIKIDGVNIKEYKLSSLLKNVGYVSQDTFIMNDTVATNIAFGSREYSRNDVIEAARYANADSFISELPNGYDTIVGDKGMKLSGGQAQRIAIARAMVRKPDIMIFDEATNNLDNISEAAVQKAIEDIASDHTVIMIAHRLSTVANADKILVLENGKVTEQGTHSELITKKGVYTELHQS